MLERAAAALFVARGNREATSCVFRAAVVVAVVAAVRVALDLVDFRTLVVVVRRLFAVLPAPASGNSAAIICSGVSW